MTPTAAGTPHHGPWEPDDTRPAGGRQRTHRIRVRLDDDEAATLRALRRALGDADISAAVRYLLGEWGAGRVGVSGGAGAVGDGARRVGA